MVQILYIGGTLLAFTVLMLSVHIRIGQLEERVRELHARINSSYGRALWGPPDYTENDHD